MLFILIIWKLFLQKQKLKHMSGGQWALDKNSVTWENLVELDSEVMGSDVGFSPSVLGCKPIQFKLFVFLKSGN